MGLEFAIVRFKGEGAAVLRYADAKDRSPATPGWTQKVGFVERHHNGHLLLRGMFAGQYVDVDEGDHISQLGAGEGAVAGGVLGVLGGPPGIAVGLVVGGLVGAEVGRPSDTESEPQELVERLRAAIPPSSSAIVLSAEASDVDEMLSALGGSGEDVVRRPLTADEEARLDASLRATPPATA